ncbi:hypothetical protein F5Y08DRAFT_300156 [Xylaria arbuscula]|uniref:Uncharacterized protein n=1 Tax=Xylaria arbuscula TaxID=114810 RepID=A0A9W8NJA9_9PEZI|nr:hypothetical protein F5Y08DRAFT_300156 [Xylaria arbuscula]KAJ3577639.1 hypothetical protein NPX13_g2927 [Xylaria arbuscula]
MPQPLSPLEAIPEELLLLILGYAMTRNSPFQIDYIPLEGDPDPNNTSIHDKIPVHKWFYPAIQLTSSSGRKDPLSFRVSAGCPHRRDKQETHIADWIIANSVSRRMRRLGRRAFFESKSIAIRSTVLRRTFNSLTSGTGFARIVAATPEPLLSYTRHLILADASEQRPTWMLSLVHLLSEDVFPALREVTLVFGHGKSDGPEWMTAAVAVAEPLWEELRRLLGAIGVPPRIRVTETLGTLGNWPEHRSLLQKFIVPILELKERASRAKLEGLGGGQR